MTDEYDASKDSIGSYYAAIEAKRMRGDHLPYKRKEVADDCALYLGDCRDVLRDLPDNSIDAVVTDPPYALVSIQKRFGKPGSKPAKDVYARGTAGFMGKQWDTGEVAFSEEFWTEVLRVLKPGGHVVSFGGTRTYHRMACAIEDAGFEIRDQIQWLYGTGFPKSHNQKGEWQGWGTALKPANEPICLARKPLDGTVAQNVLKWGTGAINIDGCGIPRCSDDKSGWSVTGSKESENIAMSGKNYARDAKPDANKRFPANVITDGSVEMPNGAQRFFYSAKASKADRGEGNTHPTVKPTDLMRWLCRLVTPPGGVILDPFMGSGSTGKAALLEGFGFVGIEREEEYFEISKSRIEAAKKGRQGNEA